MALGTRKLLRSLSRKLSPAAYCYLENLRNRIRGRRHSIKPFSAPSIYEVYDGQEKLFICRRERHKRSARGVLAGVNALAAQYHIDQLELAPGDLLIDCGANIGELALWADKKRLAYIGIEPENLEAQCCNLNAHNGHQETKNVALWYEATELSFFSKPGTADSSLIEIGKVDEVRKVKAVRLDDVISIPPAGIKVIMKVEAEGAEPEVLKGAPLMLKRADYVTVDCGYERGIEKKHTFIECQEILLENGFKPKFANFRNRITILYEKTK